MARESFNALFYEREAFTHAKEKFDSLASVIRNRDLVTFNQTKAELDHKRSTNEYVQEGMKYYEGVIQLTDKQQHDAIVSAVEQYNSMELD